MSNDKGKHIHLSFVAVTLLAVQQTAPIPVTVARRDILGPKLTASSDGIVWIVWAEYRNQEWDVYAKSLTDGVLSTEIRITDDGQSFVAGGNGDLLCGRRLLEVASACES